MKTKKKRVRLRTNPVDPCPRGPTNIQTAARSVLKTVMMLAAKNGKRIWDKVLIH
jgi:hypothetical protein